MSYTESIDIFAAARTIASVLHDFVLEPVHNEFRIRWRQSDGLWRTESQTQGGIRVSAVWSMVGQAFTDNSVSCFVCLLKSFLIWKEFAMSTILFYEIIVC